MSRGRDAWLARREAARRLVPQPRVSRATAARRVRGGWQVTVHGQNLFSRGTPGAVEVGGVPLTDVRFSGSEITGRLLKMPETKDVTIRLGATSLPALQLRISPRPVVLPPERARSLRERLRRVFG
jgi:hypothetical protein